MRISAKGQYALAAVIEIAEQTSDGGVVPAANIAEAIGISKLSLEQTMLLLKKGDVIYSTKGAKGGYQLARDPKEITVFDILMHVENTLLETMENTVLEQSYEIEKTLRKLVFDPLDQAIIGQLCSITLQELIEQVGKNRNNDSFMINM